MFYLKFGLVIITTIFFIQLISKKNSLSKDSNTYLTLFTLMSTTVLASFYAKNHSDNYLVLCYTILVYTGIYNAILDYKCRQIDNKLITFCFLVLLFFGAWYIIIIIIVFVIMEKLYNGDMKMFLILVLSKYLFKIPISYLLAYLLIFGLFLSKRDEEVPVAPFVFLPLLLYISIF